MKLKPGVRILGVRPEMAFVMPAIQKVYENHGVELVVTSAIDGKHSRGSLHYAGAALDLRTRDCTRETAERITDALTDALGQDFDVVLESNHIHLEYQAKLPY